MKRLDGGLATTLQAEGLLPYTPVEPWLLEHPDRVAAAHRRFVEAGAQVVLAATFRCLPSERPDWSAVANRAVDLAREAHPDEVWLTLGAGDGHADVVREVGSRVDGVVLETFTDAGVVEVIRAVRAVWKGPLVASLVPGAPGRLLSGQALAPVVPAIVAAGANGVGLNCAAGATIVAAAAAIPEEVPLWVEPRGGDGLRSAWRALRARASWMGGCCGTTPEDIAALG